MKKPVVLFILLFILIFSEGVAQSQNNITWRIAVVKYTGSESQTFSPQRPSISMKSGDEYQIFIGSDSSCYCYVIQEISNNSSLVVSNGPIAAGKEALFPEEEVDFIIPPGTGTIRFYVVISSLPKTNLERYCNQNVNGLLESARHTAVIDEILSIRGTLSTITEIPEKPVVMGGAVRGKTSYVYQYEGQNTYVRIITIKY